MGQIIAGDACHRTERKKDAHQKRFSHSIMDNINSRPDGGPGLSKKTYTTDGTVQSVRRSLSKNLKRGHTRISCSKKKSCNSEEGKHPQSSGAGSREPSQTTIFCEGFSDKDKLVGQAAKKRREGRKDGKTEGLHVSKTKQIVLK